MTSKGQVAIEFSAMVGMAAVFFVVLAIFAQQMITQKSDERIIADIRDIALTIQSEFLLAAELEPGYVRTFEIQSPYHGHDVVLTNSENAIDVEYHNQRMSVPVPTFSGTIQTGPNTLRKDMDGGLHLNE